MIITFTGRVRITKNPQSHKTFDNILMRLSNALDARPILVHTTNPDHWHTGKGSEPGFIHITHGGFTELHTYKRLEWSIAGAGNEYGLTQQKIKETIDQGGLLFGIMLPEEGVRHIHEVLKNVGKLDQVCSFFLADPNADPPQTGLTTTQKTLGMHFIKAAPLSDQAGEINERINTLLRRC